jgi:predicted small secreted protein
MSVLHPLVLAALVAGAAALAACSTTEGFGKDVKHLGGGIEDSAARNK